MANEIRHSTQFAITKGNFKENLSIGPFLEDQTGTGGGTPGTQAIGTSEEAVSFGDIAPGYVILENLDPTNYVTWGPDSGGSMVAVGRLLPGAHAIFYLSSGASLRMQANSATCEVRIRGYDA